MICPQQLMRRTRHPVTVPCHGIIEARAAPSTRWYMKLALLQNCHNRWEEPPTQLRREDNRDGFHTEPRRESRQTTCPGRLEQSPDSHPLRGLELQQVHPFQLNHSDWIDLGKHQVSRTLSVPSFPRHTSVGDCHLPNLSTKIAEVLGHGQHRCVFGRASIQTPF